MPDSMVYSYCPRCDKEYKAGTKREADALVRDHLARQIDETHEGALDAWDDGG